MGTSSPAIADQEQPVVVPLGQSGFVAGKQQDRGLVSTRLLPVQPSGILHGTILTPFNSRCQVSLKGGEHARFAALPSENDTNANGQCLHDRGNGRHAPSHWPQLRA